MRRARRAPARSRRPWDLSRMAGGVAKYGPVALVDCLSVAATYAIAVAIRTEGRVDELGGSGAAGTLVVVLAAGIAQVVSNIMFAVYWRDWSVAALEDVTAIAKSTSLVAFGLILLNLVLPNHYVPTGAVLAGASFVFVMQSVVRLRPRWPHVLRAAFGRSTAPTSVIVVGAGRVGALFAADTLSRGGMYHIACFVDDDRRKQGSYLRGIRVAGGTDDLPRLIARHRPSVVVIAVAQASGALIRKVVSTCDGTDVRVRKLTDFGLRYEDTSALREIGIDELLVRDPVQLDTPEARDFLRGRIVLVTGAAGSIGSELSRQISRFEPGRLILLDTSESGLHDLQQQLGGSTEIALVDIRDRQHLRFVFERSHPDVVFHAAAYKHVPILERAPLAALATNVVGTANVLACCIAAEVRGFVFVSTDKAVEPTNVLGYTKRFGEILTIAASREFGRNYAVVRFGNVLASSGSAVPTFAQQIDNGGPVTVTHPEATRYFMTIPEAAGLVIEAGAIAEPGDLLVLEMGAPVPILDLVRRMITLRGLRTPADIPIEFTGLRPGEKMHESLFFPNERALATRHSHVRRVAATGTMPSLAEVQAAARRIEECVSSQDADGGLAVARQLIGDPDAVKTPDRETTRVVDFRRP
jgi:FlaA1/EpsC-like NDP-sugar epimerase